MIEGTRLAATTQTQWAHTNSEQMDQEADMATSQPRQGDNVVLQINRKTFEPGGKNDLTLEAMQKSALSFGREVRHALPFVRVAYAF